MIALLTDFEYGDGLGVVKGVIKTVNPKAEIVDLYNHVENYSVRSGAWLLLSDYKYFPEGTVFCCIVDPGVGGSRKAIAVKTENYCFVGPDNGLMHPAAAADGIRKIVGLPIPDGASKTFHGRGVFAPAAAKLDNGVKIEGLSNEVKHMRNLDVGSSSGFGEIVLIDHYGNIATNLVSSGKESYGVSCGDFKKNLKFHSTYEEAIEGELFVIEGSRNTLELSVKQGSATEVINCRVGDKITIR